MKEKKENRKKTQIMSRAHAGLYSYPPNRDLAEASVVDDLEKALAVRGKRFFSNPRRKGRHKDPPDCEAEGLDGKLIGIEVTELVDQSSVNAAARGSFYEWKNWKDDFLPKLEEILQGKDSPDLKGVSYSQYVLLVHSDEPWLELDYVERCWRTNTFKEKSIIERAFFIMYEPLKPTHACFELNIAKKETP